MRRGPAVGSTPPQEPQDLRSFAGNMGMDLEERLHYALLGKVLG